MKKTAISVIAIALCLVMTALCLASCGSKSAVIGSWDSKEAPGTVYTFSEDGTGVLDASGTEMKFTYVEKDNTLEITYEGAQSAQVYEYTVKDDVLSLNDKNSGSTIDYKKK